MQDTPIKQAIKESGLTNNAMAYAVNRSPKYLSQVTNGIVAATPELTARIERISRLVRAICEESRKEELPNTPRRGRPRKQQ